MKKAESCFFSFFFSYLPTTFEIGAIVCLTAWKFSEEIKTRNLQIPTQFGVKVCATEVKLQVGLTPSRTLV